MKRGEHQWFISEDGIAALKWKNKLVVHVISNYRDPCTVVEEERKDKSGPTIKINCPIAVQDYNVNMNFVDKFDQIKKTYEIDRKSHKWWRKIFFYFLDALTVNAFINFMELMSYRKVLKAFRLEILDDLVATTSTKKRKSLGSAGPSVKVSKHKPHTLVEMRKCQSAH